MKIFIGTDILKISNVEDKIKNKSFFNAFTENEINYSKNKKIETLAGIFSAKESLIKAFSKITNETLGIKDFEILHKGKIPYVNILNKNLNQFVENTDISISHNSGFVQTVAVLFFN